jgi:hypothetical protein
MPQHSQDPPVSGESDEQTAASERRVWRAPTATEIPVVEATQAGVVLVGGDFGIYS